MIFDKGIDSSLWMIVHADKENSDEIIDFIKDIPEEFRLKIIDKLSLIKTYDEEKRKFMDFIHDEVKVDDLELYWFLIDSYHNELQLGCKVYNGHIFEDTLKISLSMREDVQVSKFLKKEYIGKVEYDIYTKWIDNMFNIVNSSENDYYLVKTPIGYLVTYSNEGNKGIKSNVMRLDILDIPDDIFVSDLYNKDNRNKLVRRRMK